MPSPRSILLAAVFVGSAGGLAAALAADEGKADRAAPRAVQSQLHNRFASERAKAVERLRDSPPLEAARLIAPLGLNDPAAEVRRAAYEALLTWKDDRAVCDFLRTTLDAESHSRKGDVAAVAPIIAVLLASELPETELDWRTFLDRHLAVPQDAAVVVGTLADELGRQGDRPALLSLQKLTRLKCFYESFACRRAVVQAMILIRRPEAVDALMAILPRVDGEVRGDIVRYFSEITGQQHGINSEAWQAWWKGHQKDFAFPAKSTGTPAGAAGPQEPISYYGLAIYARRMVFVLDTSGSMEGPRLSAAKRELVNVIGGLPEQSSFNIVTCQSQVTVWQKSLASATAANKQAAVRFVQNRRAGGSTATYDALRAAMRFDAEAVYFLSDGEPTVGKIVAPAAIASAVGRANRSRRISVYSIGIAPGPPGGPLDSFLKTLAQQNFGVYRRVDH